MVKKILIALLVVLVIIQFIHPAKNVASGENPQSVKALYGVPDNVEVILQKACYDCHSDNTRYPWYNNIQPVAWWLNHHIKEGKHHLNFSEFGTYTKAKQVKKLNKVAKAVHEGWMPIDSYLWIHKDAVLTKEETQALADWATGLAQKIENQQ